MPGLSPAVVKCYDDLALPKKPRSLVGALRSWRCYLGSSCHQAWKCGCGYTDATESAGAVCCELAKALFAAQTVCKWRTPSPCPAAGRPPQPLPPPPQAAEDVNVTFEDQQKINKFARNTSRITELKEEIEVKKKQLQNLEDACDDIMMLDDGDSLLIPYQIGDVFISHSQEETQEMLEEAKKSLQEEIEVLESRVESIQRVLSDLKVQLYAKFGNNINLEAEDS
ncbi:PREDICTED: prefoldin subunit 4 [Aptenodytes forsteri]|uniref:prefoldin subunit 4 n=1 Tax=Aptenodytes forsteri TaxID=9233 RepID=UPI000905D3A9|nr:PREDICTED: prefoldin subunit 4 [Aptenodytes forsteri]